MPERKIGLALSSGVARGLAHIGVLEVLEREGIHVDMIAGTSIGALVGALYAYRKDINWLKELAIEFGAKRFSWLVDPALPRTGLIRGRKVEENLKNIFGDVKFEDLQIPVACVATDIDSGDEVVIREGLVWEALRASISIPVVLTVFKRENRYLVDGGLVNPVPVSVLKKMGADFIIAVNVIPIRSVREAAEPGLFTIMMQTLHIGASQMVKASLKGADIVIEPEVDRIAHIDFHRAEELILQGWLAAGNSIAKIKRRYKARFKSDLTP